MYSKLNTDIVLRKTDTMKAQQNTGFKHAAKTIIPKI